MVRSINYLANHSDSSYRLALQQSIAESQAEAAEINEDAFLNLGVIAGRGEVSKKWNFGIYDIF